MDGERCAELLLRHGIKPTANRIVVVKALAAMDRPLSLTELECRILSIDKSGVFRTLTLFRKCHMVHVIEDGSDGVRYELCRSMAENEDDDTHVHFFCECCHRTYCMEGTHIPEVALPDGYIMSTVNYVVKGLCPTCASKR